MSCVHVLLRNLEFDHVAEDHYPHWHANLLKKYFKFMRSFFKLKFM